MGDRGLGAVMLGGGLIALIIYVLALFAFGPLGVPNLAWWLAITIVALIAVGALCVVIIWIGYTLITTPAPTPPSVETGVPSETKPSEEGKSE